MKNKKNRRLPYSQFSPVNFSTIEKALEPLQPIGILVNNVAMNYNYPQLFHSTPIEGDEKIVHTNISVTNRMTKLILPRMIQK